jgi:hypothetical protein
VFFRWNRRWKLPESGQRHMELEPDLAAQVAALIRELDGDFRTRSAATAKLLGIGPLAVGLLRAELQEKLPLETRRRIEAVLERVDATSWLELSPAKSQPK